MVAMDKLEIDALSQGGKQAFCVGKSKCSLLFVQPKALWRQ